MVKNTIDSKKCGHAQALLGTYVHFYSYYPIFFKWLFIDTIFEYFLVENSFPWSKLQLKAKSVHEHKQF